MPPANLNMNMSILNKQATIKNATLDNQNDVVKVNNQARNRQALIQMVKNNR